MSYDNVNVFIGTYCTIFLYCHTFVLVCLLTHKKMKLKSKPRYDSVEKEWRCDIDQYTTIIAPTEEKMKESLKQVENYIRYRNDQETTLISR